MELQVSKYDTVKITATDMLEAARYLEGAFKEEDPRSELYDAGASPDPTIENAKIRRLIGLLKRMGAIIQARGDGTPANSSLEL